MTEKHKCFDCEYFGEMPLILKFWSENLKAVYGYDEHRAKCERPNQPSTKTVTSKDLEHFCSFFKPKTWEIPQSCKMCDKITVKTGNGKFVCSQIHATADIPNGCPNGRRYQITKQLSFEDLFLGE